MKTKINNNSYYIKYDGELKTMEYLLKEYPNNIYCGQWTLMARTRIGLMYIINDDYVVFIENTGYTDIIKFEKKEDFEHYYNSVTKNK